jgi:hypothetical protein
MYAGTWAAQWSTVSGKGTARAVRRAAGDALVFFFTVSGRVVICV